MPGYYPITAYEAQSGQTLRVHNRPGNVHDGKASLSFLRALFAQLAAAFGGTRLLEFRMDAAFFRRDVLALLQGRGAQYAIKVPFQTWTGLREIVRTNRSWTPVDATVSCFERQVEFAPSCRLSVIYCQIKANAHAHGRAALFRASRGARLFGQPLQ